MSASPPTGPLGITGVKKAMEERGGGEGAEAERGGGERNRAC